MAIYLGRWGWGLGLAGVLLWGEANLFGSPTLAQITPDATLGAESSVVTPNVNVREFPADRIEGGAVRGTNLFHSFQEFNVGNGQRVYFANPTGIENILSRVTGNNLSNILGTLGVDGGANLFLLNPNGIIFGSNAQLDIAGSFVASTANSVVFDNGFEFSANNPESPPLLTVNVPLGVQYGTNQSRTTITNTGNLAAGQNLTLDAGNLDLQGQLQAGNNLTLQAQDTVKIRDSITNPFVAAAGEQLLVQGNQIVDIFALNHPNSGLYSGGDMVLRSPDAVMGDAHYWSGGNFRIEKLDGSLGDLESPDDPIIRASGDVNFANYIGASLHIFAGGSVTINDVTITGADLTGNAIVEPNVILSNGTTQDIDGINQPTLDIRAGTTAFNPIGNIGVPLPAGLTTTATPTSANITIGNIDVTVPNGLVFLTNQYQPNTTLPGGNIQVTTIDTRSNIDNGGNVIIDSRGNITLPGNGFINTSSSANNAGNVTLIANGSFSSTGGDIGSTISSRVGAKGGDINIQAESLFLSNASVVENSVSSGGIGNAGNVNINVRNSVTLTQTNYGANPTLISSEVGSGAVGNGGKINIRAGSLLIEGTAGVQVPSEGRGNAGNVFVQVDDSVSLIDGGIIYSPVSTGGQGNAGTIQIFAPNSVTISGVNPDRGRNGGVSSGLFTSTATRTSGQAGGITVNTGVLRVQNGAVVNASTSNSSDGGTVGINANSLELTGGGQILAVTRGSGSAGTVSLNIADTVTISGSDPNFLSRLTRFGRDVVTNEDAASGIYTDASLGSTGNGGNLDMLTRQLNVSDGGQILTSSFGTGNAGELSITATDSINVVNPNSRIITSSFGSTGNGGKLSISTSQLNVSDAAEVATNSFGAGKAGDLSITNADTVTVSNQGLLSTGSLGSGNGGTLSISTRQLDVINSGLDGGISTIAIGTGNSGNLSIVATESMNVVGGSNVITSSDKGTGIAGSIDITTNRLSIRDGSRVVSSTIGAGDAGDVTIRATDSVEVVNLSKLSSDTFGNGNAGDLNIETGKLSIQNAEVSTGTFENSTGRGGNLSINASNVELIGGSIATATRGQGEGGDIRLQANSLNLSNQGTITSSSEGKGNAGNAGDIFINLSDRLTSNRGIIAATSAQTGGGDINITADDIRLRDSSVISSSVFDSNGGGGNITIKSTIFLALDDSDILANADAGPGGSITINSPGFVANLFARGQAVAVGRNPGDLSRFRNNGQVDISDDFARFAGNNRTDISTASVSNTSGPATFPNVEQIRAVASLPSDLVDPEDLIDRRCAPSSSTKTSRFTITGRGGLPPNPNDPLMYQDELVDWVTLENPEETSSSKASNTNSTPSHPQQLVEAQGWVIGEDGKVMLTASASTATPGNSGLGYPSCEENQATTD
ncbi:two-partner secretion domain-containing protein [Allocoleopsis franciscana]|uniref:Filamentous hemagglutinin family N-terminal domain protein n=1 Tax=Allocoleopsis franciscana PCC 7113 TaxID=1173027 RepID=K9WCA9_9CYAN|nr:filamentous hemagglutinin N-terminal domain-containing protein [Allocoleopsis franciscana]AFZ17446.1 filamentous hemagglutinin family N-terminal domain protein [Allocoleopsis franciscana PCC 7113]